MHTVIHLIIAFILAIIIGIKAPEIFIFILATVIVDIDHFTDIIYDKQKSKKDSFFIIFSNYYNRPQKTLHFFHTFEIITLLFLISIYFKLVFYIALAFSTHLIADAIGYTIFSTIKRGEGFSWFKNWFLTYYLIKGTIVNK